MQYQRLARCAHLLERSWPFLGEFLKPSAQVVVLTPMKIATEKADRFILRDRVMVSLAFPQENGDPDVAAEGQLLDISHQGARFLTELAPPSKRLRVEWQLAALELSFFASAMVCWKRKGRCGTQIGCAFGPTIPEPVFERILSSVETERRDTERRFANATVQLTSGWRKHRVKLVNYSTGGFCLHTKRELSPGDNCRITLEGFAFQGNVQWALADGDGFLAGCAFADEHDFNRIDEIAAK